MKTQNLNYQDGITLIITSVMLVAVLFLTLATMKSSIYNRTIATSVQTEQQTRIAAEAAVRQAEELISSSAPNTTEFQESCDKGLCTLQTVRGIWNNASAWNNAKKMGSDFAGKSKFINTPEYLIEYMGERRSSSSMSLGQTYQDNEDYTSNPVYRITGQSKDKKSNRTSVIQSTVY